MSSRSKRVYPTKVPLTYRYWGYEDELKQLKDNIEEKIIHLEKSSLPCKIVLKNKEESIMAERVYGSHGKKSENIVARVNGGDITIPVDDILDFEYKYR